MEATFWSKFLDVHEFFIPSEVAIFLSFCLEGVGLNMIYLSVSCRSVQPQGPRKARAGSNVGALSQRVPMAGGSGTCPGNLIFSRGGAPQPPWAACPTAWPSSQKNKNKKSKKKCWGTEWLRCVQATCTLWACTRRIQNTRVFVKNAYEKEGRQGKIFKRDQTT